MILTQNLSSAVTSVELIFGGVSVCLTNRTQRKEEGMQMHGKLQQMAVSTASISDKNGNKMPDGEEYMRGKNKNKKCDS